MLKKIDTESKTYKNVREGISWFSGLGSAFTLECMSIPFTSALIKNRLVRLSCFSGIVTMSTLVSFIGHNMSSELVDSVAYCWNKGVDKLTELRNDEPDYDAKINDDEPEVETKQVYVGLDIPGKNATPIEEKQFIADLVDTIRPFEFDTEVKAKEFVEDIAGYVGKFGHVDIAYAFTVSGHKLPIEVYDVALKFGWTTEDVKDWGVDEISRNCYIADVFNYHDISDRYQTLKEE